MGLKGRKGGKKKKKNQKLSTPKAKPQESVATIDQEALAKVKERLGLNEVTKVGGSRRKTKLNLLNKSEQINYYHKVGTFLGKTPHIIVDNPIISIQIFLSNEMELYFDHPNNFDKVVKNYSMFYIRHGNCFIIRRDELIEEFRGDVEGLPIEVPQRTGNRAERKFKNDLVRKCHMQKYPETVTAIVFTIEDGERWILHEPELWTIGSAFYVLFGTINTEIFVDVPENMPVEEQMEVARQQSEARARKQSRKQEDPRKKSRMAQESLKRAADRESRRLRATSRKSRAESSRPQNTRKEAMRVRNVGGNRHA